MSPAAFCFRLTERARAANKRIVLPEGTEPRTVRAAAMCVQRGIARCVLLYLDNPEYRAQTEARALEYGRMMAWPQVAQRYIEVFQRAAQKSSV
jgi:phosphate acetyltransferase